MDSRLFVAYQTSIFRLLDKPKSDFNVKVFRSVFGNLVGALAIRNVILYLIISIYSSINVARGEFPAPTLNR